MSSANAACCICSISRDTLCGEDVCLANSAYRAGTINRVSTADMVTPNTMTIPIGCLDSQPAPLPSSNGNAPKVVAALVIRMGRNRTVAASTTASVISMPRSRSWLANSTINTPFFAERPMSRIDPIWLKTLTEEP